MIEKGATCCCINHRAIGCSDHRFNVILGTRMPGGAVEQLETEPLHKRERSPGGRGPVQGGPAVPAERGCGAERSTLDGVATGKRIAPREAVRSLT
jgi:hypothetical protein